MAPVLRGGDYVLAKNPRRFTPGCLYVIDHADLGLIVKRMIGQKADRFTFEGINPASSPASTIGTVEARRITGHVRLIIGKSGIRRV